MNKIRPSRSPMAPSQFSWLTVLVAGGQLGLQMAVPIVVMVLIGIKADKTWGTLPLFTLIAMALGGLIAFIPLRRALQKLAQTIQK